MTAAPATPVVKAWIAGRLSGDSTLAGLATGGIYGDLAPEGAVAPYVVWNILSPGVPSYVSGTYTLWEELVLEAKAVDRLENYGSLVPIANRIHVLLQLPAPQTITGGILEECQYAAGVERIAPPASGITWCQVGQQYRIRAQAT